MDLSQRKYTVGEIAIAIGAQVLGNTELTVTGMASPKRATENQLALAMSRQYYLDIGLGKARAAVLGHETDWQKIGLEAAIILDNPRLGLSKLTGYFKQPTSLTIDMRNHSIISGEAVIGEETAIGPFSYIGPGVVIGNGCLIGSHVSIESGSKIGKNGTIQAGVRIGQGTIIGDNFICHYNSVIGCDGFSYETGTEGAVEQVKQTLGSKVDKKQSNYSKVFSLGNVRIGDNVEIGACTAIDRGTIESTVIGDRTKIDNLVHIAHNVIIGEDCLLCGQVGIAGSSKIGNRVVLAGQTGVKDHIKVGNDVIAGGATKIYSNVPNGTIVMGSPAVEMKKNIATYKATRKLPKLFEKVSAMEKKLSDITKTGD